MASTMIRATDLHTELRAERPRGAAPDVSRATALGRLVPASEHWRLFPDFRGCARFLDIETMGLALEDPITMVGISDAFSTTVLVSGRDLTRRRLVEELSGAGLLVTFNGTAFDLPRLERAFPGLPCWRLPHLDLAPLGRQVGLSGGLKAIERTVGYRRPPELQEITGAETVAMWRAHQAGDREALPKLIRYCRADTESLVGLAELIYERLANHPGDVSDGWIPRAPAPRPATYFGQQLRQPAVQPTPRVRLR